MEKSAEAEGEARRVFAREAPVACVSARPNFVDGATEGRPNFSLKYHHCSTASFLPSVPSPSLFLHSCPRLVSRFANLGDALGDESFVVRCPFSPFCVLPLGDVSPLDTFRQWHKSCLYDWNRSSMTV